MFVTKITWLNLFWPRWVRHSYLSKVLRYTPILVGHQDYFLAPLPGSEALLVRRIDKGIFYCECCFYFCLLLYFIMLGSPFDSLFGGTAATAKVVDDPPPTQLDPFKIPMKIVERVMDNCYYGDGTIHPGDHLQIGRAHV